MPQHRLLLASTSPRRRNLLPLLGFPVEARSVDVDERPRAREAPAETAGRLAVEKAEAGGLPPDGTVVVGADTIVVLDGKQLGKPDDPADAARMLAELRGRSHLVVSGVALRSSQAEYRETVATTVEMRSYTDAEIARYVASGRPLDKAGAYAIQDEDFRPVERIDGCYLNVVGLPLCAVVRGLRAMGWPLDGAFAPPPCELCHRGRAALEP